MTPQIPEYMLLQDSFYEPNLLRAGSRIRTMAPPGPHLEPLNAAAVEAFDAWYSEEMEELDPKTKQPTGRTVRPREQFRIKTYSAGAKHDIEVLAGPSADDPGSLSLAETLGGANRRSTDQRPGPAVPRSAYVKPEPEPEPVAEVLEAAKPALTAKRN